MLERQLPVIAPARVARYVGHEHRLAAGYRSTAGAMLGTDGRPFDRSQEGGVERRRCSVVQRSRHWVQDPQNRSAAGQVPLHEQADVVQQGRDRFRSGEPEQQCLLVTTALVRCGSHWLEHTRRRRRRLSCRPNPHAILERLAELAALYLVECELEGSSPEEPAKASSLDLSDYGAEGLQPEVVYVAAANVNEVSVAIGRALREEGASHAELARRTGVPPSVVTRISDPLYFGHTSRTLRSVACALAREVRVAFERAEWRSGHDEGRPGSCAGLRRRSNGDSDIGMRGVDPIDVVLRPARLQAAAVARRGARVTRMVVAGGCSGGAQSV